MHVHTTVKVRAANEQEAIDRVNYLLTGYGEYRIAPFDWVSEEETKISASVKTERQFAALRGEERKTYRERLKESKRELDENFRGMYLRLAGECLESRNFWSTERVAYELDSEGAKIFYVDTDRHC